MIATTLIYAILILICVMVAVFVLYSLYAIYSAAPFVPMSMKRVRLMIERANLRPGMRFIDLGSGDGRIVMEAAKSDAICTGIEINPTLLVWSRVRAWMRGQAGKVSFQRQNLWLTDVSEADVVSIFFIHPKMNKLMKKLQREMKPGAKVLSYRFKFEGWPSESDDDNIHLYIVPNK